MSLSKSTYLIREGFRSIRTHGFMSFASVTIITACLIIMGSFALLSVNVDSIIRDLEEESEVLAFVDESLTEEDARLRKIYFDVVDDSLRTAARAMRAGIDRVDPSLPGLFCCVGNACEAAADIASILAGEGNPVVVRLNNGNYTPVSSRFVSSHMQRAATQIAVLRAQGHVDAFLAETDTCPQNRYSTGAQSLHTHFTSTILEGAAGAKHWITRLGSYEPKSGKAYRRILAKNAGFYRALAELTPELRWTGCRIPVSSVPDYGLKGDTWFSGWAMHVLERLGLPLYFSEKAAGATFLDSIVNELTN